MLTTITDVYQAYERGCEGEEPARTPEELRALMHLVGLRYETIGPAFWRLVFGDGDEPCWGSGELSWPTPAQWDRFEDEREDEDDAWAHEA